MGGYFKSDSKKMVMWVVAVTCICGMPVLPGCAKGDYVRTEGLIWNTSYHITYKGKKCLVDSVTTVLNELDESLNVFNPKSTVSRINSGVSDKADSHFSRVYRCSESICRASEGMFDPTLSPLIKAWGFGQGHEETADTAAIDSVMAFVGMHKSSLEEMVLKKDDSRLTFNFSAIAKGYACDVVGEMFLRNGVEDFMVEIGGEIAVGGKSPRGGLWSVSIDCPEENDSTENHDSFEIVGISDCGMATSGNYRNFRRGDGGAVYGHTISAVTGRPVATDVLSATVIAPTAMEADAAATAVMAIGSEKGIGLLRELGYEGLLVLADTTSVRTPGFGLR